MPRNRGCCSGGYTFGCLVVVGAYSVLISISFAIVTSLYMTGSGTGCENIEAENAKIVSVTHVDLLNQDNSVNGEHEVKEPVDEKVTERIAHRVYCDCGTQTIYTFFEITVLIAAITGLVFMMTMCLGLIRGTFLRHKKRNLNLKKLAEEKEQKERDEAVLLRIANGELTVPSQPRTGSAIEVPS